MSKGCLVLLFFVCFPAMAFSQTDTVYIQYKPIDSNYSFRYYHELEDSAKIKFPFMESVIYNFDVDGKQFKLSFVTNPLDKEAEPFYYYGIDSASLANINWIDNLWIKETPLLDIIRRFRDDNIVIMLYDTTQLSCDSQYVVRVYFTYEGYE